MSDPRDRQTGLPRRGDDLLIQWAAVVLPHADEYLAEEACSGGGIALAYWAMTRAGIDGLPDTHHFPSVEGLRLMGRLAEDWLGRRHEVVA